MQMLARGPGRLRRVRTRRSPGRPRGWPLHRRYIAAAGWIGHAAWDVAHHRDLSRHEAVGVVPRGYAEFCIVVDLLVGASLIAAPVA
jgi:hypothetical protein